LEGGINLYVYVNGNSLVWTDPYGLWCISKAVANGISACVGSLVSSWIGTGFNFGVAFASCVFSGIGSYLTSDNLPTSTFAAIPAGIFPAFIKGGGGRAGAIGGAVAGAMGAVGGATAKGELPNTAGSAVGGFSGGLVGGMLSKSRGAPFFGGALGLLAGAAG
jgi:hypothetical protein